MGTDYYFLGLSENLARCKKQWEINIAEGQHPTLVELLEWAMAGAQYCTIKVSGGNRDKWHLSIWDMPPDQRHERLFDSLAQLEFFLFMYLMEKE